MAQRSRKRRATGLHRFSSSTKTLVRVLCLDSWYSGKATLAISFLRRWHREPAASGNADAPPMDLQRRRIAAPELAVDPEIEEGEFPGPFVHLQANPDRPDILRFVGSLLPDELPLVAGLATPGRVVRLHNDVREEGRGGLPPCPRRPGLRNGVRRAGRFHGIAINILTLSGLKKDGEQRAGERPVSTTSPTVAPEGPDACAFVWPATFRHRPSQILCPKAAIRLQRELGAAPQIVAHTFQNNDPIPVRASHSGFWLGSGCRRAPFKTTGTMGFEPTGSSGGGQR